MKGVVNIIDSNETMAYENGRDAGYSEGYQDAIETQKELIKKFYFAIRTLGDNCKIVDMIISKTIKNEEGEEVDIIKFEDVKSFAQYIKCFNDLNANYIQQVLGEGNTDEIR